jgi:hypothetical protein
MTTATEPTTSSLFDQAFEFLKKTVDANVSMQKEVLRQWGTNWPAIPQPQSAWVERVQKFQNEWAKTVKALMYKHRETLDEQYRLATDSLHEAFLLAQSSEPQEFAKRCETLCRKSLQAVRDAGEAQIKETHEALNKWMALVARATN